MASDDRLGDKSHFMPGWYRVFDRVATDLIAIHGEEGCGGAMWVKCWIPVASNRRAPAPSRHRSSGSVLVGPTDTS
eukprot:1120166-Rhodomonas_salina.3